MAQGPWAFSLPCIHPALVQASLDAEAWTKSPQEEPAACSQREKGSLAEQKPFLKIPALVETNANEKTVSLLGESARNHPLPEQQRDTVPAQALSEGTPPITELGGSS